MNWKEYALSCFKKEEFVDIDPDLASVPGAPTWRFKTHDEFLIDTNQRNGCIAAASLSLLFRPKIVVEMGVNLGWTSLLLSRLNPAAEVHGVDAYSKMREVAGYPDLPVGYVLALHKIKNYQLHIQNSWDFIQPNVELCFIDADHSLPAVELDTRRAWENRNKDGDWCIAWDDYHINNIDVYNTVNKFVEEIGYPLQKIASWYWIGNKTISENDLANYNWQI